MWHPLVRVFALQAFYSFHFLKFSLSIKKNVYIYLFVYCWLSWILAVSGLSLVVSGGLLQGCACGLLIAVTSQWSTVSRAYGLQQLW